MQKLKFNINGKHYEATVAETSHNVAEVELNGKKYTVEVERAESVAVPHIAAPKPAAAAPVAAPAAAPKAAAGANSVTAPLPGSVTVVNVKAGDAVKAGQTLIIIEAMKMENEVLAPADGTVTAVHVSGGQAVQQGDALLDLA
ncbi:biotin/lipoyl-binding protein [Alistipes sp. Z76]|nr:biotin/lipoyl-binding protein [Alistipes sp. Z76]NCE66864.1 biotin/lipoyl-binding protein [Muribaculaceae bacterium M3]